MIIIVFGLPGTGKSYFAKHLEKDTGMVYINTDIVRERMGKQGKYDPETKQLVYDEMLREMEENALAGDDVLLDGTFYKETLRSKFVRKARDIKASIFFIEMKASDETVKNRLKTDRQHSEADYEVYLRLKEEFEPLSIPHLVLWSDIHDLDDMLSQTKKIIDGKEIH